LCAKEVDCTSTASVYYETRNSSVLSWHLCIVPVWS